jgi:hypothetical protein
LLEMAFCPGKGQRREYISKDTFFYIISIACSHINFFRPKSPD